MNIKSILLAISLIMICMSCAHKQTGKQEEKAVIEDSIIGSEDTTLWQNDDYDDEKQKQERNKEDSLMIHVVFPKPDVELVYSRDKEYAIAKRVQEIYDDVLETYNYMFHEDKDFFKLYWSKSLYTYYKKASEYDDCIFGAYPYTSSQEVNYSHLYKVTVANTHNDRATVNVTFGVYGIDEIYTQKMTLYLQFERGNWYIDDIHNDESMSVRETIKHSIKQQNVL